MRSVCLCNILATPEPDACGGQPDQILGESRPLGAIAWCQCLLIFHIPPESQWVSMVDVIMTGRFCPRDLGTTRCIAVWAIECHRLPCIVAEKWARRTALHVNPKPYGLSMARPMTYRASSSLTQVPNALEHSSWTGNHAIHATHAIEGYGGDKKALLIDAD